MASETWEAWYPGAAARGLLLASASIAPSNAVWFHAAPDELRIEVRDREGTRVAHGEHLRRAGAYIPMTLIHRDGEQLRREDRWPHQDDLGTPVILPGGEAGILTAWWNAEDGSAWRWSVEFTNHR